MKIKYKQMNSALGVVIFLKVTKSLQHGVKPYCTCFHWRALLDVDSVMSVGNCRLYSLHTNTVIN